MNLEKSIEPSSTQLNADDLISGPRTITITKVWGNAESATQPVSIGFDGDNGRPYLPCKSMRRCLVSIWGVEAKEYVGRSLTIFCDQNVSFGGMKVGGIRISHASHIDGRQTMALTVSRARRAPYTVEPLVIDEPARHDEPKDQHANAPATDPPTEGSLNVLFLLAQSTAQGGTETYKNWFIGLTTPEKHALQNTEEPDRDDFDKVKSVHEAAKGIALRVDRDE